MHVHVYAAEGELKVWLEPEVALAASHGLNRKQIGEILKLVREKKDAIKKAWYERFPG